MSIQLYSSPMKYKDPNTGNYTNIIGISGNPGRGISSVELNNDYTLTIVFDDNTSVTTTSIRGNGIENIEKTSTSGLIDTYTITDSDGGTYTFTVSNGMVPNLTIGTVVEGASAAATITGTSENPVLNLVLPKADTPVTDVQVAGVSVLSDGVANVPIVTADSGIAGVVKVNAFNGLMMQGAVLSINAAYDTDTKAGTNYYKPITPIRQHQAAFYGLAKAAGADMKDIANTTVGTYPDAQKEAIQSMLGITQMLAPTNPNLVASQAYAIGDVFAANGHLYKATAAIAQDGAIIPDTNCVETTMVDAGGKIKDVQVAGTSVVGSDGVASVPVASSATYGVAKISGAMGVDITNGFLTMSHADSNYIQQGAHMRKAITPKYQHEATFYGLSKVAGVDLANETVTLGTYPEASKTAIKEMLGVQDGLKVVRLI